MKSKFREQTKLVLLLIFVLSPDLTQAIQVRRSRQLSFAPKRPDFRLSKISQKQRKDHSESNNSSSCQSARRKTRDRKIQNGDGLKPKVLLSSRLLLLRLKLNIYHKKKTQIASRNQRQHKAHTTNHNHVTNKPQSHQSSTHQTRYHQWLKRPSSHNSNTHRHWITQLMCRHKSFKQPIIIAKVQPKPLQKKNKSRSSSSDETLASVSCIKRVGHETWLFHYHLDGSDRPPKSKIIPHPNEEALEQLEDCNDFLINDGDIDFMMRDDEDNESKRDKEQDFLSYED